MFRKITDLVFDDEPDGGLHPFIGIPGLAFLTVAIVYSIIEASYWIAALLGVVLIVVLVSVINAFRARSWF